MSHPGHRVTRCRYCRIMMGQCRCAEPNKPTHWITCEGCARQLAAGANLETSLPTAAMLAAGVGPPPCSPVELDLNAAQPAPVRNDHPAVWDLVLVDMARRDAAGRVKYGTPLQPHNGRDALVDAYQEVLDLAAYLRQQIYERDGR